MTPFDPLSALAVLTMVAGLAAVLGEILVRNPSALLEIADDSRRFAEAPLTAAAAPAAQEAGGVPEAAAKAEHPRLAA